MSEDWIKHELDQIAVTQKTAIKWLLGIAGSLLVAFLLSAATLMLKVERIDTVISERFSSVIASMQRLEMAIGEVSRTSDGKYDGLAVRVRDIEGRVKRLETYHEKP